MRLNSKMTTAIFLAAALASNTTLLRDWTVDSKSRKMYLHLSTIRYGIVNGDSDVLLKMSDPDRSMYKVTRS